MQKFSECRSRFLLPIKTADSDVQTVLTQISDVAQNSEGYSMTSGLVTPFDYDEPDYDESEKPLVDYDMMNGSASASNGDDSKPVKWVRIKFEPSSEPYEPNFVKI